MSDKIFRSGFNLGVPAAEELDREIRALQRKRDQAIADHLLGIRRTNIGGMEVVLDPSVPEGQVELRNGRQVCAIINLG